MTYGGLVLICLACSPGLHAADRILSPIDTHQRVTLPGNTNGRIKTGVDMGPVEPSMQLPAMMLVLKPSATQQAALDRLLIAQQDPSSPDYHVWLTPEQYGDRFGLSQADMDKISAWLEQGGFTMKSAARARNGIAFGGTAAQAESAFGVEIHRYRMGGETHFANTADPLIPAALQGIVLSIRGLHDFHPKPMLKRSAKPRYTQDGAHYLGPGDTAAIYDINPLYSAGIDGSGQTIAIVGQTDILMSDIEQYRSFYGLPANDPTVILVPGSPDPGIQVNSGDLGEADLDLELSGAIARNATILFVNSSGNYGYGGAFQSLYYAINENIAPVISVSYGDCELDIGAAFAQTLQSWGMQANAQGQTIFAASGDDGAADCAGIGDGPSIDNALSVDMPGSLPQVTSVGGTEFNEGSGNYWNSSNGTNEASARSYIPEIAWNDSVAEDTPAASGGGASVFFSKPSWQTGTGVPSDGARDVPDVSISASPDNDAYYIYSDGSFQPIGGTSVGGPQFAGITALLSHYLVSNGYQSGPSLGNVNPTLYPLATVSGVYHDITSGNNIVNPCLGLNCIASPIGYSAGVGFDLVTGWGTPDVYNLVSAWHAHTLSGKESVTMSLSASAASLTFSGTTVLTATVKGTSGSAPTGVVTFSIGDYELNTANVNSTGVATLPVSGVQLAVGVNSITASYSGDNSYYGNAATANVTITSATNGTPAIASVTNSASYAKTYAGGGIMSVFGTNLAPATGGATTIPLPGLLAGTTAAINGYSVSFYYVSPTQLNLQIPYEVAATTQDSLSTLTVTNNGINASYSFYIAPSAPAIFTTNAQGTGQGAILDNSNYQLVDTSNPATPGSTYLQIYCTGLGAVNITPVDGAASPSNPPAQTTITPQVTIGGVTVTPSFSGLAPGYVGLYQINVQVPTGVASGSAVPVIVSAGGVSSNTVTIAVQ